MKNRPKSTAKKDTVEKDTDEKKDKVINLNISRFREGAEFLKKVLMRSPVIRERSSMDIIYEFCWRITKEKVCYIRFFPYTDRGKLTAYEDMCIIHETETGVTVWRFPYLFEGYMDASYSSRFGEYLLYECVRQKQWQNDKDDGTLEEFKKFITK